MAQFGANTPPALTFELVADCGDHLDNRRVVARRDRLIVLS